jgi:hypothetical protein
MVPWSTIVFQGHQDQAKGALPGRPEPRKKLTELNRRKIGDFERKLANFDKAMITSWVILRYEL